MAYGLEKVTTADTPIYQQLTVYYKFCERCRMSPRTMEFKTQCINYFVGASGISRLEDISNEQVDDWIDLMISHHNTGRTINHRLAQLKVMLRWERDDNVVMPNLKISRIVMQKEVPPRKVFYTREQINKALSFADRREWLMIKIAFDCGLRISELRNLRLSDISDRRIRIIGKGQKLRYVKMSKEARKRLDDWIRRENVTDFLWVRHIGANTPITDDEMRKMMKQPFRAAGFADFRPHDLRHSYATELKKLGLPTRLIQVGMGHSSEAITERYLSDLDGFNIDEIYDIKDAIKDSDLR